MHPYNVLCILLHYNLYSKCKGWMQHQQGISLLLKFDSFCHKMNMNNNTISDFNVSYWSAKVEQNINSDSNRPWPKVAVYFCELSWGKSCFDAGKLPSSDSYIFLVNYLETRCPCCRKTTSRLNELLLGDLRTNREQVILPSSQSKIREKILSSLTNQHSVILPAMLLL